MGAIRITGASRHCFHAAAALGGFISIVSWQPSAARAAETCTPDVGRVVSVQGEVQVRRTASSPWQAAALESRLCRGDTIRVGDRSRAAIALINEAVMRLDQNTTLQLTSVAPPEKEERSLFSLVRGVIQSFSRKPRKLGFNTPYLNATIEGTEIVLRAGPRDAEVTVAEGDVKALPVPSIAGVLALDVTSGQAAIAEAGKAPTRRIVAHPRDAAQWALYYPPVLAAGDGAAGADVRAAASLLDVGRVDEARAAIDRAIDSKTDAGLAYALRSVIKVVQNDKDGALADARRGVQLEPKSAAAKIALSYAQQARFDLPGARATMEQAVADSPRDALAWARLSELRLMLSDRSGSRAAADKAVALAPNLARTQYVLGFAALTAFDIDTAEAAFRKSIALDSADPLPRLGLGLAIINNGDVAGGRKEIEVAAGLDAQNALIRAYLGKAYYAEKREPLDAEQFAISKQLDPLDPTPWLYDAILKQTQNNPVGALGDLRQSIDRNDNRAVYRGRLELDKDRAARGASLARIFGDLGFTQSALDEATGSLALDPGNASAHRFVGDSYRSVRRREIARVSEDLQAQMLQDININPVQPSQAETNLNIVSSGGPAEAGFNEFTPLFERNQVRLNATGAIGDHNTRTGEGVVSAIYDRFSISAGAFKYDTDGWRTNNNLDHTIYNAYAQGAVTPDLNFQAEVRKRRTRAGDLAFNFDPMMVDPLAQHNEDQTIGRVGMRYAPTQHSKILLSYIYTDREAFIQNDFFGVGTTENPLNQHTHQVESQYLYQRDWLNVVAGFGYSHIDQVEGFDIVFGGVPVFTSNTPGEVDDYRGYVYANVNMPMAVTWTAGVSYAAYDDKESTPPGDRVHRFNPKFGVQWNVIPSLRLRAAYTETVKPALGANRTLEPTQVAGFNQLFDDANGTRSTRSGVGADWQITPRVTIGGEATWRDITEGFIDGTVVPSVIFNADSSEETYQAFGYWTPCDGLALRTGLVYDRYAFNSVGFAMAVGRQDPMKVETISVPLSANWFHPSGFFAGGGVTFVSQNVERLAGFTNQGYDEFYYANVGIGYRFPKRLGIASLQVTNLFDQNFNYQDDSYREFQTDPATGPYFPQRMILGRVTLNF